MRCVIISGSPDTDAEFIKKTVKTEDYIICADRGYCFAKEANGDIELSRHKSYVSMFNEVKDIKSWQIK